jgi:lysophospholipase L1-like esterase
MPNRFILPIVMFIASCFPFISFAEGNQWDTEISRFDRTEIIEKPLPGVALFYGSSSIRMWRTIGKDLAPSRVLNRGFGGSTIADCTHYIPRLVVPYKPSIIFLYAGDNDIAAGKTPEQVLADFREFVTECRKSLPSTPIQYISIKPSPARWNLWEKSQKANDLIKKYIAGQKNMGFVDVATPMLDPKGMVRGDLFLEDRLHMNAAGYSVWVKVIKPILATFEKPKK